MHRSANIAADPTQSSQTARIIPDLNNWLATWGTAWGVPDFPSRVRIEFSPRLRRSLGRCLPVQGVIRLHVGLREVQRSVLREVICHEAAHVATWILHEGRSRSHSQQWRNLMVRAGYEPRARWVDGPLSEALKRHNKPSKLYDHRCPICGAHWVAKRSVPNWRCGACLEAESGGRLEISTRPVPKDDNR